MTRSTDQSTAAAQRRILEALAAFHHQAPSRDPLGALLVGIEGAIDLNADQPQVAAIFTGFADLIGAVRTDLTEEATTHG